MNCQRKFSRFWSELVDYAELFVIAVSIVLILFSVAFRTCTVDGDSMNKTLIDGQVIVVSDTFYSAKRGDSNGYRQERKHPDSDRRIRIS